MRALSQAIDKLLDILLGVLMAALVVNVVWQVVSRYLLNDPSSLTEEIARFLLLWIGMLGGCYAYRERSHLGLDLITSRLARSASIVATRFVVLVTILFALVVLVYGGGRLVWLTLLLEQRSPSLGIPMGYIYGALPLSGALITLYALRQWPRSVNDD